jgi:putative transposase
VFGAVEDPAIDRLARSMARRLRIQYPGALYHIINRGNYRRDLFETAGAAQSFETALDEACTRFGWLIHAFDTMRNHFHLALETPDPNLVDGMHWLQSTYGTRFNRFRSERGHLFQGRYQSLLIEDDAALLNVVNYIHLNPVQARIVSPEQVADFRWSSLRRFIKGPRPPWLSATSLLSQLQLPDSGDGWARYVDQLIALARDPAAQKQSGFDDMTRGWAIGTQAWRQAVAQEYSHLSLNPDLSRAEIQDLKQARWEKALRETLQRCRKNRDDIIRAEKYARWKIEAATRLRTEAGAPYRWISDTLKLGSPASVRVAVCRRVNM